ncbi:RNA-directed DNA polymerase [Gossypium australe]|uniref:RNA-directed DNA polymerase n=1 Tax=Gossypium australe TaxID=47621 RepID=A0A5B6V7H5_9ROSI|nr:RNA-directed DNA polymerase [Gossypium australe]
MPERIIFDNALNLNNRTIAEIKHHNSLPYRPKMNGAVETTNKNIKKIVGKMTSAGAMPFSLVYGMGAVLPIEVKILSLRVLSELKLDEAEWIQSRYNQLNLIEEKRLKVIHHGQMYQKRMMRAYEKKGGPGIEKDHSHTKGLQRKVDAKLGRTLCGKEGLFWRSADFD